jgi:hypothetical protein
VVAWNDRHLSLLHQGLGGILQAHGLDGRGRRTDENDAILGAGLGELCTLRQEAVAGMDGGSPRPLGDLDDPVYLEIALTSRRRTDEMRLVRHLHEKCLRIGLRIDRDRAHPQPLGSTDDAAGDLAAVGNQDALEHFHPLSVFLCGFSPLGFVKARAKPR